MIDFELTKETLHWKARARSFAREFILNRDDLDKHAIFPIDLYEKAFDEGLITSMIPKEYGGQGRSLLECALAAQECAYADLGFTTSAFLMRLSLTPLLNYGTHEQKIKWVKPLTEKLGFAAFCFTEPEGSTNLGSRPASTTVEEYEGGYILNGNKWTISNGSVSSLYLVFARLKNQKSGLSCFVVERDYKGVSSCPPHNKMGQRAADTAEVCFENVFIPKENLVGRIGEGHQIALASLKQSRLGVGAMALGVSERARDLAKNHCHNRLDGNGKPIIFIQDIKFRFAEIEAKVEMMRSFLYRCIWEFENSDMGTFYSSSLKFLGARMAIEIVSECLDLHGGTGYLVESKIEKLLRDTHLLKIYEGTEAVQKMMISDFAIRLPKDSKL